MCREFDLMLGDQNYLFHEIPRAVRAHGKFDAGDVPVLGTTMQGSDG